MLNDLHSFLVQKELDAVRHILESDRNNSIAFRCAELIGTSVGYFKPSFCRPASAFYDIYEFRCRVYREELGAQIEGCDKLVNNLAREGSVDVRCASVANDCLYYLIFGANDWSRLIGILELKQEQDHGLSLGHAVGSRSSVPFDSGIVIR